MNLIIGKGNLVEKGIYANRDFKKNEELLIKRMLSIIRKNPGIRPSELNRLLNIPHTWNIRKTLLKRGLIRKEKDGLAVRYYLAS